MYAPRVDSLPRIAEKLFGGHSGRLTTVVPSVFVLPALHGTREFESHPLRQIGHALSRTISLDLARQINLPWVIARFGQCPFICA